MGIFSDILLTVDYDRTLTGPDSSIPERNIEAIRYFIENGGAFTVNTGRSVPMTKVFRDMVPVNAPLLLYNGSAAYNVAAGKPEFYYEIPLDLWEVRRKCEALFPDLTFEVQALDAHYRFSENPAWDAFSDHNQCARGFAQPGDDLGPFLKFTLYGEIRRPQLSDMFNGSPEEFARMDEAEQILNRVFGDTCAVFRAAPRIIDVHAKGVSKARAARELQKQLGRKTLVCVGDARNDILMLEAANFAFVPGDAILADRYPNVCNCGDGAVADVIYREIPKIVAKQA